MMLSRPFVALFVSVFVATISAQGVDAMRTWTFQCQL